MQAHKVQYIDSSSVHLEAPQISACASCRLCPTQNRIIILPKTMNDLSVQDEVELRLTKAQIGGLLFLVFILPTLLGLVGLVCARQLGWSEPNQAFGGIGGMGLGWLIMTLFSRRWGHVFLPQIVEVRHHA